MIPIFFNEIYNIEMNIKLIVLAWCMMSFHLIPTYCPETIAWYGTTFYFFVDTNCHLFFITVAYEEQCDVLSNFRMNALKKISLMFV